MISFNLHLFLPPFLFNSHHKEQRNYTLIIKYPKIKPNKNSSIHLFSYYTMSLS
jgi:hypothetical protein